MSTPLTSAPTPAPNASSKARDADSSPLNLHPQAHVSSRREKAKIAQDEILGIEVAYTSRRLEGPARIIQICSRCPTQFPPAAAPAPHCIYKPHPLSANHPYARRVPPRRPTSPAGAAGKLLPEARTPLEA